MRPNYRLLPQRQAMLDELLNLNDSEQFKDFLYPDILSTAGRFQTGYAFAADVVMAMSKYRRSQGDLGKENAKIFVEAVVKAFLDGSALEDALSFIELCYVEQALAFY